VIGCHYIDSFVISFTLVALVQIISGKAHTLAITVAFKSVTANTQVIKNCQYNENQSLEDESTARS